jgi:amidase
VAKHGAMRHRHRLLAPLAGLAAALLVLPAGAVPAAGAEGPSFPVVEATVADVHAAFAAGELSCVDLVQAHLERIAAYDDAGPQLQAVLSLAPDVLGTAADLDARYAAEGPTGPLHCIPVLVKDNVDTADLPTTAGSRALETARPPDDARIAAGLREAGAIVLGKANLDEFAFGFAGSSSLGGQVRNPYDPSRGPGGSSSGTGAAVAASLAVAGVGTDTGGSIRVPSSVQGLVGIRPSMRLVSQDGIVPLAHFQDTAGPMCRTVQDCALVLDAMVGFDDSVWTSGQHTEPMSRDDDATPMLSAEHYAAVTGVDADHTYTDALDAAALDGARIGVVRGLFGSDPDVVAALESAITAMQAAGATVEDATIPDLSQVTGYSSVSAYEFRDHLTEYLMSWPSVPGDLHKRSFEEVAASLQYETGRAPTFALYGVQGHTRYQTAAYDDNTHGRTAFVRPRVRAALDNTTLAGEPLGAPFDALLYPSVQSPPAVGGPPATGSNNRLSPFTGFPALSMPAGFTPATPDRVALPIGMELLGREFDEATLIGLAYAYQQAVAGTSLARQAPTFTPELVGGRAPAGAFDDMPAPSQPDPADLRAMAVDEQLRQ